MSLRFKICLTAWVAVVAAAACQNQVSGQELTPVPLAADEAQQIPKPVVEDAPPIPEAGARVKNTAKPPLLKPEPVMQPAPAIQPNNVLHPEPPPMAVAKPQAPAYPVEAIDDANWQMTIRPALKARPAQRAVHAPAAEDCESCPRFDRNEYTRIYNSIPFNRAEYNVNPNYRHDSAMEILTGNARHQTTVRHSTTRSAPQPAVAVPADIGVANPSRYGYLRPALRLNYYKYFPSLNPYINRNNLSGAF